MPKQAGPAASGRRGGFGTGLYKACPQRRSIRLSYYSLSSDIPLHPRLDITVPSRCLLRSALQHFLELRRPSLKPGDLILVAIWAYKLNAPVINDIAIFSTPDKPAHTMVKRVADISGDGHTFANRRQRANQQEQSSFRGNPSHTNS